MGVDIIVSGDCVPYGIRAGVSQGQTFASLIAQRRQATYLNVAYYYGTVAPRPHTSGSGDHGTNPNTGLNNNVLDQFNHALSFDPTWWLDMSGEASVFRFGGLPTAEHAEPPEVYRAGLITLCQRWALAGKHPDRMVLADIVPQVLVEDVTGEAYYRTEVPQYNQIRHEVAKMHGATVIYLHDHMLAAMYSMANGGAAFFDPTGTEEPYNHWHNHLQPPGHIFIDALLTRPQYDHLFVMPTGVLNPPSNDEWTVAAGPAEHDGQSAGWSGYTIRQAIPITVGGSEVKVIFKAGSSEGLSINDAFIGKRSGSYGFTDTPARLLFSQQSGVAISAGGTAEAVASMSVSPGDVLLVAFHMDSASADSASRRAAAMQGWSSYYATGNSAAAQSPSGYTVSGNAVDAITTVKVK